MTGIDNIDDDDDVSATKKRPILNLTTPIRIGGVRRNRCKYRRIVGTGMVTFGLANAPTEINGLKILKKKNTPPTISIHETYTTYKAYLNVGREVFLKKDDSVCNSLQARDFKYSNIVTLYKQADKGLVENPCSSAPHGKVEPVSCKFFIKRSSNNVFHISDVSESVDPPQTAPCDCKGPAPDIPKKFGETDEFETIYQDPDILVKFPKIDAGCSGTEISSFREGVFSFSEKSHAWFCQEVLVEGEKKKVKNFCSLRYNDDAGLFSVVKERTVDAESKECP